MWQSGDHKLPEEGQPLLTSRDLCQCEYMFPELPLTQDKLDTTFFVSPNFKILIATLVFQNTGWLLS